MSEPAFPTYRTFSGNYGQPINKMVEGISQRRLLAGMILSGWLSGNHSNPSSEPWTVYTAVKESLEYADELIKQTEDK